MHRPPRFCTRWQHLALVPTCNARDAAFATIPANCKTIATALAPCSVWGDRDRSSFDPLLRSFDNPLYMGTTAFQICTWQTCVNSKSLALIRTLVSRDAFDFLECVSDMTAGNNIRRSQLLQRIPDLRHMEALPVPHKKSYTRVFFLVVRGDRALIGSESFQSV